MTEYGVTSDGFIPKPFSVILEELKLAAKQAFGEDIDLSVNSRLLRFLEIVAKREDELWQMAEDAYYAGFIDFATGSSLDFLAALVGYKRIEARRATGTVTFSRSAPATSDIIIPAGTRVASADGSIVFRTTEAAILAAGNTSVDAPVEAIRPGSDGNVAANTITKIIDPISGIEAVNNSNHTTGGRDAETDEEFRYRIKTTIQSLGKATLDAIVARVRLVGGVKSVKIEENDTMEDYTTQGGLPPKSFRVFVYGGDDSDIAQAIFDAKPAGIRSYGSVEAIAYDIDGNPHTVYFERPTPVEIYVSAQVTTDGTDVTVQEIKDAIKAYFDTLSLGDDVIYNKVVAAVMSVKGVIDASVAIGTTYPPEQTSNIAINTNEVAVTDDTKITITIA